MKLKSVLTDDMQHCIFTGSTQIHIHHIFPGTRRKKSDQYNFVVPLAYWLHEYGPESVHENPNTGYDLQLKQMAQTYFEKHIGSRQQFIAEFGRNYL